jgi:hypothetical protein
MDNGNDLNGWGKKGKDKRISSSRQYFLVDLKRQKEKFFFLLFFCSIVRPRFLTVVFSNNP